MNLPRSSPSEQGVDPDALLAVLDAWEADPAIEMHSVMVVRHGHVVAEGWWAPYTSEGRHLLYSVSKSFTATALGLAVAEGLLDLDEPVVAHFPELAGEVRDERTRTITLRHLASMASGHDRDVWHEAVAADPANPVRGFLTIPPDHEPGTVFAYNQPCTFTLAGVLERVTGMSLTDYLRPRVLDPLGIGEVGWVAWPGGHQLGFTGMYARTEDVAKLGLLHLQRGRWGSEQLLPASWVDAATTSQVDTSPAHPNVDWQQGYGFCFWQARHGYRGDGAFGQFCVVLPEHDLVVATTAGTEAMQSVLEALWTHLLPGLGGAALRGSTTGSAEERLQQRLAGLALAPLDGAESPVSGWLGELFAAPPGSGLSSVSLVEDGWSLALHEQDNELTVPFRSGEWAVASPSDARGATVPVAASGGWADESTLEVDVIFLETPHTLRLRCTLPDRRVEPSWRTEPLQGASLEVLHSP